MSQANEPAVSAPKRPRRWAVVCVAAISATTLASFLLADWNSPIRQERWQWLVSAAIVAVLLSGAAIALGRDHLSARFGGPLTGLFAGLVAAAIGGCINAAIEWSLATIGRATPSLYLTVTALPVGAAVGTAIGLIRGRAVAAATVLSAVMLAGGWFAEMDTAANQERWRWTIGSALVALVLGGTAIVFGRQRMRAAFLAPLTGLFAGVVAVIVLAGTLTAVEWLGTGRVPMAVFRVSAFVGLPAGAILGLGVGLIGWAVPKDPRRWAVVCVTAISAATLASFLLADLNNPAPRERWQWLVSAATVSVLLSGAAIALGRRHLRAGFRGPLTGLLSGLAAGALAGCVNAAMEWSLATIDRATPSLYPTITALPVGAALGTAIGLIRSRAAVAATVLGAALLIAACFVELDTAAHQQRWRWTIGVSLVAVVLIGSAIARRERMRAVLLAPLTGIFVGLLTVTFLGGTLAAAGWLATGELPRAALRVAALAGLPVGAALGLAIGPIAWAAYRSSASRPASTSGKRRRFQFSLRTLLLAVLVVAVLIWIAEPARQTYEHRRVVNELLRYRQTELDLDRWSWFESLIGSQLDPKQHASVRSVSLNVSTTDDDLRDLQYLPELKKLELICPNVTDAGFEHMESLRDLEWLAICCPNVTAKSIAILPRLPRLKELYVWPRSEAEIRSISECANLEVLNLFGLVSDEGLEHLAQMGNLRELTLTEASSLVSLTSRGLAHLNHLANLESLDVTAPIGDNDLAQLTGLSRLRTISLRRNSITDAGLVHLEALPSLNAVVLDRTQVTPAGAARLRQVLQARHGSAVVVRAP